MNKLLKVGAYGSTAGILGILAKPVITSAATSIIGNISVLTKGCYAIGSTVGVGISGGSVLGLVVLTAICTCVDLNSINYKKLLGWEDTKQSEDIKEEIMIESLANIIASKIKEKDNKDGE